MKNHSRIDEEDIPDISELIDPIIDEDEDEDEQIRKAFKKLDRYIKKNHISPKTYQKKRTALLRELKHSLEELNLLLAAEARITRGSVRKFIMKQDRLRQNALLALFSGVSTEGKIIIIRQLLRELENDPEPTEYYIW